MEEETVAAARMFATGLGLYSAPGIGLLRLALSGKHTSDAGGAGTVGTADSTDVAKSVSMGSGGGASAREHEGKRGKRIVLRLAAQVRRWLAQPAENAEKIGRGLAPLLLRGTRFPKTALLGALALLRVQGHLGVANAELMMMDEDEDSGDDADEDGDAQDDAEAAAAEGNSDDDDDAQPARAGRKRSGKGRGQSSVAKQAKTKTTRTQPSQTPRPRSAHAAEERNGGPEALRLLRHAAATAGFGAQRPLLRMEISMLQALQGHLNDAAASAKELIMTASGGRKRAVAVGAPPVAVGGVLGYHGMMRRLQWLLQPYDTDSDTGASAMHAALELDPHQPMVAITLVALLLLDAQQPQLALRQARRWRAALAAASGDGSDEPVAAWLFYETLTAVTPRYRLRRLRALKRVAQCDPTNPILAEVPKLLLAAMRKYRRGGHDGNESAGGASDVSDDNDTPRSRQRLLGGQRQQQKHSLFFRHMHFSEAVEACACAVEVQHASDTATAAAWMRLWEVLAMGYAACQRSRTQLPMDWVAERRSWWPGYFGVVPIEQDRDPWCNPVMLALLAARGLCFWIMERVEDTNESGDGNIAGVMLSTVCKQLSQLGWENEAEAIEVWQREPTAELAMENVSAALEQLVNTAEQVYARVFGRGAPGSDAARGGEETEMASVAAVATAASNTNELDADDDDDDDGRWEDESNASGHDVDDEEGMISELHGPEYSFVTAVAATRAAVDAGAGGDAAAAAVAAASAAGAAVQQADAAAAVTSDEEDGGAASDWSDISGVEL